MICDASKSSKPQENGPFHRIVWQGLCMYVCMYVLCLQKGIKTPWSVGWCDRLRIQLNGPRPLKLTGRHGLSLNLICEIGLSDMRQELKIIVTWDIALFKFDM